MNGSKVFFEEDEVGTSSLEKAVMLQLNNIVTTAARFCFSIRSDLHKEEEIAFWMSVPMRMKVQTSLNHLENWWSHLNL